MWAFSPLRKDQSVKFPEDFSVTVPNLLKFILRYSSLPSSASDLESCTKECLQKEEIALQQRRTSHLEREIEKLRSEVSAIHQTHEQLEAQLSESRAEERRLQQQKHTLERQRKTLQLHSEHLQTICEQKNKELEEMAEKLQELADASENLLKENALLRVLVASMERKLENKDENKKYVLSEEMLSNDNTGTIPTATDRLHDERVDINIDTRVTEQSKENRTE